MGWLAKLFGGGNPIKDAGEALDNLFTSDEEREQARAVMADLQGKLEMALQQQFTERWKADMASDSRLSKNVRPGMWIASGVVFFTLLLLSPWFAVPEPAIYAAGGAFGTISTIYIPAREYGKAVINRMRGEK